MSRPLPPGKASDGTAMSTRVRGRMPPSSERTDTCIVVEMKHSMTHALRIMRWKPHRNAMACTSLSDLHGWLGQRASIHSVSVDWPWGDASWRRADRSGSDTRGEPTPSKQHAHQRRVPRASACQLAPSTYGPMDGHGAAALRLDESSCPSTAPAARPKPQHHVSRACRHTSAPPPGPRGRPSRELASNRLGKSRRAAPPRWSSTPAATPTRGRGGARPRPCRREACHSGRPMSPHTGGPPTRHLDPIIWGGATTATGTSTPSRAGATVTRLNADSGGRASRGRARVRARRWRRVPANEGPSVSNRQSGGAVGGGPRANPVGACPRTGLLYG